MGAEMVRDASISRCGQYRYWLYRGWDRGPIATWIMLNPSTADASTDDATVRRVIGFSKAFGCAGCEIYNLYAYRATNPRELWNAPDPVGRRNNPVLRDAARLLDDKGGPLIAAWGAHAKADRVAEVLAMPGMDQLQALDLTKAGQPKHPLYLRADLRPQPWRQPVPTT
jgi:hypothetical protein